MSLLFRLIWVACLLNLSFVKNATAEENSDLLVQVSTNTAAIHTLCRELADTNEMAKSKRDLRQSLESLTAQTRELEARIRRDLRLQNSQLYDEVSQSNHALQVLSVRLEQGAI